MSLKPTLKILLRPGHFKKEKEGGGHSASLQGSRIDSASFSIAADWLFLQMLSCLHDLPAGVLRGLLRSLP